MIDTAIKCARAIGVRNDIIEKCLESDNPVSALANEEYKLLQKQRAYENTTVSDKEIRDIKELNFFLSVDNA